MVRYVVFRKEDLSVGQNGVIAGPTIRMSIEEREDCYTRTIYSNGLNPGHNIALLASEVIRLRCSKAPREFEGLSDDEVVGLNREIDTVNSFRKLDFLREDYNYKEDLSPLGHLLKQDKFSEFYTDFYTDYLNRKI